MTSPYVVPTKNRLQLWRIVLTALVAIVAPPAAVVAGFAAEIVGSGCLIECNTATDDPNPVGGLLLWLLTLALALAGPVLAWVLLRKAIAVVLAAVPIVVVVGLLGGA